MKYRTNSLLAFAVITFAASAFAAPDVPASAASGVTASSPAPAAYTEEQYQAQIKRCEKIASWLSVQPWWPPVNLWGWPESIVRAIVKRAKEAKTQAQRDASYAEMLAQADMPPK